MKTLSSNCLKALIVSSLVAASVGDAMAVTTTLSDSRSLNTSATLKHPDFPETTDTDSAAFSGLGGDWDASIRSTAVTPEGRVQGSGQASQVSSVLDGLIEATLHYAVDGPNFYTASTLNVFNIQFSTDEHGPSTFNLEGSTAFINREGNGYHQESLVRLSDLTTKKVVFEHEETRDNVTTPHDAPPVVFAESGILLPHHVYELVVFGTIDKTSSSEGTFFDTITVALSVSVPDNTSTGLLLAIAIGACVVMSMCLKGTSVGLASGGGSANFQTRLH